MPVTNPIVFKIQKFGDQYGENREPGVMEQLLNTSPTRVFGSECTRYGYTTYGSPYNSISNHPVDGAFTLVHPRIVSVENPSAKDVQFAFGTAGGNKHIAMYDWVSAGTSTWATSWVYFDELKAATLSATPSADATSFTSTTAGLSTTADYYNQWLVHNTTQDEYAYVTDYSEAAGTGTFTTLEKLGSNGLGWVSADAINLYRWAHSYMTAASPDTRNFTLSYQTPSGFSRDGVIRLQCGVGTGSDTMANLKDLWCGYINRTFGGAGGSATATYKGTYVDRRGLVAPVSGWFTIGSQISGDPLTGAHTYYIGIAYEYDSFQVGPLTKYTQGYDATGTFEVLVTPSIIFAQLDKRATAVLIFMAVDDGDTTSSGRVNPFYLVKRYAMTDLRFNATNFQGRLGISWVADVASAFNIGATVWGARQDEFQVLSGYADSTQDIDFPHDLETGVADRQFIGRVYKLTDAKLDLDNIYTNPVNGTGQIQPDIFSDEPGIFIGRVLWGDSTYLSALISTARGRLLCIKDRAVVDIGIFPQTDGTVSYTPTVIETYDGCAAPITGYCQDVAGNIYFEGYNNFYLYDGRLVPLAQDWLQTYLAISTANKQTAWVWYNDIEKCVVVQFGTANTSQYSYYPAYGWRQTKYNKAIASLAVKRDSTVVFLNAGTAYIFSTAQIDDTGNSIAVQWKTGKFRTVPNGQVGLLDEVFVNKTSTESTGDLDCSLIGTYDGTAVTTSLAAQDKTSLRLRLAVPVTTNGLFDNLQILYNQNATPATSTTKVEFNGIEVHAVSERKMVAA